MQGVCGKVEVGEGTKKKTFLERIGGEVQSEEETVEYSVVAIAVVLRR